MFLSVARSAFSALSLLVLAVGAREQEPGQEQCSHPDQAGCGKDHRVRRRGYSCQASRCSCAEENEDPTGVPLPDLDELLRPDDRPGQARFGSLVFGKFLDTDLYGVIAPNVTRA